MVHLGLGERILRFEGGANEPNPRMIVALAEALGVNPMQLLLLPNGIDLKALRLASGRGASDLAQTVHVSLHAYLNWESGLDPPLDDQRILAALARELGVSTAQIVTSLRRQAADVHETDRDG